MLAQLAHGYDQSDYGFGWASVRGGWARGPVFVMIATTSTMKTKMIPGGAAAML